MMKTRILIVGGSGMLGSMMCRVLAEHGHSITSTFSSNKNISAPIDGWFHFSFSSGDSCSSISVENYDYVVNSCGLIKQKNPVGTDLYQINSVLPRQLSSVCSKHGTKLIHFSTDCIFSGTKYSPYEKNDPCDAIDDYGVSKFLGEDPRQILFRTSILGPAQDSYGLFEWFRKSGKSVSGYTNHIWSGLTTLELANQVAVAIQKSWKPSLYQMSVDPITKHDLLSKINSVFGWNKEIVPTEANYINRSLVSDFKIKPIEQQLLDLRLHCEKWNLL